jgi:hypothetical protein
MRELERPGDVCRYKNSPMALHPVGMKMRHPTNPNPFDYSDVEHPKLCIQAYAGANQHADIPSNHNYMCILLQCWRNGDSHPRTIPTFATDTT